MMVMTINNNCFFQLLPSEKEKQQYQTKSIWIKRQFNGSHNGSLRWELGKVVHCSVSTRLAVCCWVTKDSMQTDDFYQKSQTLKPEVGLHWVTRRSENYFLVVITTLISYRENRKYKQMIRMKAEGTSTGWTTDRVCREFFVEIKSALVLCSFSWRLFKKTNTTQHPQQRVYEHNISSVTTKFIQEKQRVSSATTHFKTLPQKMTSEILASNRRLS